MQAATHLFLHKCRQWGLGELAQVLLSPEQRYKIKMALLIRVFIFL